MTDPRNVGDKFLETPFSPLERVESDRVSGVI